MAQQLIAAISDVWEDSTVFAMARVVDAENVLITRASLALPNGEIVFTIIDKAIPGTVVDSGTLVVLDVVTDAPVNDAKWTVDETGHNFVFEIPPVSLPDGDIEYRVEVRFKDINGLISHVVFEVRTNDLLSS